MLEMKGLPMASKHIEMKNHSDSTEEFSNWTHSDSTEEFSNRTQVLMEGLPMASNLTGTINSLVDKLAEMKNHSDSTEEFSNRTQVLMKAVLSLKEDIFDKLAVPKVCMNQARELVFEIEDWIDQKPEINMLEEIKNFNTEIEEVRDRFTWYRDLLKKVPTEPNLAVLAPSDINIVPRLLVEQKPCHGLLDGPREKLVKYLTDEKEEMLKVVSVVGREGLGKTSLAKEIYSELQLRGQFQCQAFVSVGRKPAMTEILNDILRQVKCGTRMFLEVQGVITELRQFLHTKRYFILLDGIWSTWAWKVINCALPNNCGSRVMTTTCIIDVGNSCSSFPGDLVYQMEELSDKNSEILFRSRMTRREERIADFEEVCGDVLLNMCGGVPLGIIIAAHLLARKSEDQIELKMLGKFILSSLKQYSTFDGMTKILHMSFADLSLPARSCFIYLSVFREYETIMKDRLIRLWGAEGFIPKGDKECWWVTGERYFNELISRRLIQPVFTCDDDQVVGCTVHTVIVDFIRSISREENFVTRATELNSDPFPCDTIRRFSLDCGIEEEAVPLSTRSVHLSSMRSLTVFGDVTGKIYPPDSPADDKRIFEPEGLSSVSKRGGEMHATEAPGVGMMDQPSWDVEGVSTSVRHRKGKKRRMRPSRVIKDSRAADERISDPEGLPSDSMQGEEMHATEAVEEIATSRVLKDAEGKHDPPDSLAADERISDPEGLPSDSKQGEDMEAPKVPTKILSAFKLLRVLDLQDTKKLKNDHLKGIGGLVLLRYLGLAWTGDSRDSRINDTRITELPEEIGGLEQLETLDLRGNTWLKPFPASIVKLQKVRHLLLPGYAKEIWEMPALEVASGIRVESSSSLCTVVELLRKSEQLRMLGLILKVKPIPTANDLESFLDKVVKSKLQSLSIDFRSDRDRVIPIPIPELVVSWERVTAPLAKQFEPQRFELKISGDGLRRVPPNMGSLASLTHLIIVVDEAKAEDLLVLGGLTNLVLLQLTAYECSEGERLIIKGGIFPCLKVFSYKIRNSWTGLEFEEGAMPQLRRLRCTFPGNEKYPYIGIEHLTCLTRVHAIIDCSGAAVSEVEATEAAIRGQASAIATKPTLELGRENEHLMV